MPQGLTALCAGYDKLEAHPLFSQLDGTIRARASHLSDKRSIACVTKNGDIFANISADLNGNEWAYVLAHNLLHLAFGHFDKDKMPESEYVYPLVWNKACDIYIARFLADIGFGKSLFPNSSLKYPIKLNDEVKIYEYLLETEGSAPEQTYGLNAHDVSDMIGADSPVIYKNGEKNEYAETFHSAIARLVKKAVCKVGGHDFSAKKDTPVTKAAEWFLSRYPLIGGLAASFKIIEDICKQSS